MVQRWQIHHQINSVLPSRYTTLIKALFPLDLTEIMNEKCYCMISTQNGLHAWMPGTSMSINITTFPSEEKDGAGLHILTSVPGNHYKPYTKKVMVVCKNWKTALVSWIWWVTNYGKINQEQQVKDDETDYWLTTELRNMNVTTNPGIQTRTKRVGKMRDRCWFRFHTAHVRSKRYAWEKTLISSCFSRLRIVGPSPPSPSCLIWKFDGWQIIYF